MSENTNTPNGDSKNLYSINSNDIKISVNFMALEEKIPGKDNDDNDGLAGSNTIVDSVDIGEISCEDIGKVGYVGLPTYILTPEFKKAIEDRARISKELKEKEKSNNKYETEK